MPFRPQAIDYEGVFPSRSRLARESDAQVESLPLSGGGSSEKASDDRHVTMDASAIKEQSSKDEGLLTKSENWVRRRGHTVSFVGLFIFSVVLYFRPYETIPALSSFKSLAFYTGLFTLIVFLVTQLLVEGNLTARPREVNLVLLIGLAAILSIPLAIDPSEAWKTFNEILIKALVMFIVIVNVVRTERRLKWLLLLTLAVSIYLSIYAIQDYQLGIFKIGKLENNDLRIGGSIKGLFENSNDLALHLVTVAPIAFAMGLAKPGLARKVFYMGSAALLTAAVVVTFSRGGFLGLLAASFVLVRKLGRKNRVRTTGALVLGIVLFLAFAPGDYSSRILTIFDSGSDLSGSSSQRNQVLQRSVLVALRYPLLGVGIGNFHHKSFQELGTHNAYTQVGTEMGIAAMVFYMMFLLHPYRRLSQIERATYEQSDARFFYYLSVGLQASLVAYMVASFFAAVAYQWYVYYLVGYAIALRRMYFLQAENGMPTLKGTQITGQTG